MLLIVGHPGAGKTSLASQVCYANTEKGKKCLYITFYEDKEKLYKNMNKLGLNLADAEARGLFTYVKLPVITPDELLSTITNLLEKETFDIVVIDSINPILELVQSREEQRAILLNFFYQLINTITGPLVIVAELPLGKETLDLGSIEFVADVIIYMKHKVEYGLLSRVMEVRKLRGAPLSVVEAPFLITEKEGVKIYKPPRPERVLTGGEKPLRNTMSIISDSLGPIMLGDLIYVSYPPHGRTPLVAVPIIDLAVTNDIKVLFISFTYSPDEIRNLFRVVLRQYLNIEPELAMRILNQYFYITSYNPSAYSLTHLITMIYELIEKLDPGIIAFHGDEIFSVVTRDPAEFWINYRNLLITLKNKNKLVVRCSARVNPYWVKIHESMSDIVIRVYYKRENKELKPVFYIWRRGLESKIYDYTLVDLEKAAEDVKKLIELAKQKIGGNHE